MKLRHHLLLLIVFCAFPFLTSLATAQETSTSKGINGIVVVDIQQVEAKSTEGQSLQQQLKSKRETFQKDVAAKEKALRAEQEKLIAQKGDMDAEEFKQKATSFEKQLINSQKELQKKRVEFDKSAGEALSKLRSEIVKAVGNLATENDYKLVITRQDVVIVEKTVDITADVLERVNKDVDKITIK